MVILVKKLDGSSQPYDAKKVLNSLQHAGADIDTAKDYLFVVGDKDSEITLA